MNLLVHDKKVFKKYNEIWDKANKLFLLKKLILNQYIKIST